MFSLTQDAHGSLWVGAPGRLLRVSFDGAIDDWNRRRGGDQVPSGYIDILRLAPDGTLWLSRQGGGIQQLDVASGAVLRTSPAGGHSPVGSRSEERRVGNKSGSRCRPR